MNTIISISFISAIIIITHQVTKWILKNEEEKRKKKANIIDEWRKIINNKNFTIDNLVNDPTYGKLRTLLNKKLIEEIEKTNPIIKAAIFNGTHNPIHNPIKNKLLEQIAIIEKEWNLI